MTRVEELITFFAKNGLRATAHSEPDDQVDGSISFGPNIHIQVEAGGSWMSVCVTNYKGGRLQSIAYRYTGSNPNRIVDAVKNVLAELN